MKKYFAKYLTLVWLAVIMLLDWYTTKCHCDSRNVTAMTEPVSYEKYYRKLSKSPTDRPPSIIDLRHGALEVIPRNILQRQDTEILDLEDNRLTNLPSDVANLTRLEYINLVNNEISDIESVSVINELPNLESLLLSGNPLKSLKGLRVSSLLTLEADHCEIEEIDDLIPDSLPSLRTLNLTGNPLVTLRKLSSENLTNLVLKNCQLRELPFDAFAGLAHLAHLDLGENNLVTMPDVIFSENNYLANLNLGNNTFEIARSAWFEGKKRLRELDLSKNSISSLNVTLFEELSSLDELDLGDNKIVAVPIFRTVASKINLTNNMIVNQRFWDLSDMTRVRNLDLSRNHLSGVCDEFISTTLRILDLGYNELTSLKINSFSGLPNLMDLHLKGNQLTRGFDATIFHANKILVDIELDENPWRCNCTELYPLYMYLTIGQKTKTTTLVCQSPDNARNKLWWEFCGSTWRGNMTLDDEETDVSKTWMITIAAIFGVSLIVGTVIYVTYTLRRNRPR